MTTNFDFIFAITVISLENRFEFTFVNKGFKFWRLRKCYRKTIKLIMKSTTEGYFSLFHLIETPLMNCLQFKMT